MDIKQIEHLANIMQKSGLTSLKLKQDKFTLELERKAEPTAAPPSHSPAALPSPEKASPADDNLTIYAPTIGVFYAAPSPDSRPYVQVGDTVKKGDVLCIIEAMKLMNEITAEADGIIGEICVGNGQIVEFGQPLFRLR